MSNWHLDARIAMPTLLGLGLVATLLLLLGGSIPHPRLAPAERIRPEPVAASGTPDLCVTPRGFCVAAVAAPDSEPCRCTDPLNGTVQGEHWSLDAVLSHPGLLPDRTDDDQDE